MEKVINFYKDNKKSMYFILTIALVGLASGICFYFLISYNDKIKCIDYINKYIEYIKNRKYFILLLRSMIFNLILLFLIFICSFSVTGFFTSTFIYFLKNFIIGLYFTLIMKVTNYYTASILYIFPTNFIYIIIYSTLLLVSLSISTNLLFSIFKSKTISFKNISRKYLYIFLILVGISTLLSLYDGFILPKILLNFI